MKGLLLRLLFCRPLRSRSPTPEPSRSPEELVALAARYEAGVGVAADLDEAMRLYVLAAEQQSAVAGYAVGCILERKSNYERCADWFEFAAHLGHGQAQARLGEMYLDGVGVQPDTAKALYMLRLACRQGVPRALHTLGVMYLHGEYVPRDHVTAFEYEKRAAAGGVPAAEYSVGYMLQYGLGTPQDNEEASAWYRKASNQGFAQATCALGFMYRHGLGVPQDFNEAIALCTRAAEQGNAQAYYNLGDMCLRGQGVARDPRQAADYFRRAIAACDTDRESQGNLPEYVQALRDAELAC